MITNEQINKHSSNKYNDVQKFVVSKICLLFKEIDSFIQQECIKLIKSDSEVIDIVTKVFSNFLFIKGSWKQLISVSTKNIRQQHW